MNAVVAFPSNRHRLTKPVVSGGALPSPRPESVRIELWKILQSPGFIHSGRMRRFLEFVVEETLRGRASQLCEYSVGISVFDRKNDFEPGLDPIVRNDARRLRSKLLEYYQRKPDAQRDSVLIDIPKGTYVPSFRLIPASQEERPRARYRLSVSLIRMTDGSEILSKRYDFEGCECSVRLDVKAAEENCPESVAMSEARR